MEAWMKKAANAAAEAQPIPGTALPPVNEKLTLHVDGDYL